MFYLFNHMPKCGGTSFGAFWDDVFDVVPDYVRANWKAHPERLTRHLARAHDLSELTKRHCVVGHFNLPKTLLWVRYPALETMKHKKFSVLRDPFDTAISGVHFNIRRGRMRDDLTHAQISKVAMGRANYFARVLGIRDTADIDAVLDRYWFIAPLERIDEAAALIEQETGRKGRRVERLNAAATDQKGPFADLESEFRTASALDYEIRRRAEARFDQLVTTAVIG